MRAGLHRRCCGSWPKAANSSGDHSEAFTTKRLVDCRSRKKQQHLPPLPPYRLQLLVRVCCIAEVERHVNVVLARVQRVLAPVRRVRHRDDLPIDAEIHLRKERHAAARAMAAFQAQVELAAELVLAADGLILAVGRVKWRQLAR